MTQVDDIADPAPETSSGSTAGSTTGSATGGGGSTGTVVPVEEDTTTADGGAVTSDPAPAPAPAPGTLEETPDPVDADAFAFRFSESFEGVTSPTQLAGADRWTGAQLVRGSLAISDDQALGGDTSLYMQADNKIGKAHLFKAGYWEQPGDMLQATAHFWFDEGVSLNDVYIMDWESKSAWSSQNTLPNTQPGIRIGLYGQNGSIAVERGKMGIAAESDFGDRGFVMPREEWVKIEWRVLLGLGDEGRTQVLVNDRMVIDATGTTYIDEAVSASRGILLNDSFAFDRFKVGITANSSTQPLGVYLDEVDVKTWDAGSPVPGWFGSDLVA